MKYLSWTELKSFVAARNTSIQWFEHTLGYDIYAFDGDLTCNTSVMKTSSRNDDQIDFEDNYKADGNTPIEIRDSDGSALHRLKINRTGWGLQCHAIEFETCQLNSISSIDKDGNQYGFADIKFYNAAGTELTAQNDIDTDCVKSVMSWEPTADYEMIGGDIMQQVVPISPVRLNFYHYATGHEFCTGGMNMQFIAACSGKKMDGRTPKLIPYYAEYPTAMLCLVARHAAGLHHKMMLTMELFKL